MEQTRLTPRLKAAEMVAKIKTTPRANVSRRDCIRLAILTAESVIDIAGADVSEYYKQVRNELKTL